MSQSQLTSLQGEIERLFALPAAELHKDTSAEKIFQDFKSHLNSGAVRAAEMRGDGWQVNLWVKQGLLVGFRLGTLKRMDVKGTGGDTGFIYIDKHTYPLKDVSGIENLRIVMGGTSVRDGSYLASSVVVIPPSYINAGAYIDTGTMVDSHALVGSCAQVGKNVHLSAASQLGGVLEPIGAMPVIIEDGVMIGGNCGIYEGTIIQEKAVIGTGVMLNGSTPVYDTVNGTVLRKTAESPLIIPKGAVVVAGSRKVKGSFAEEHGLSIYTPLIIKYRDSRTDKATSLEDLLR
ncbi:MAG: 2,3,4,5-tetrahydropyridine-2,6-dicarboxylate N-succinyltransferase [Rhizobacter sp.]|nr:2,3,4,5-tetrahydropyridine-2,6-dicarboxylate N-succinyltransferase [Chlorobiales bacterium]